MIIYSIQFLYYSLLLLLSYATKDSKDEIIIAPDTLVNKEIHLPDTQYVSVKNLIYSITIYDTINSCNIDTYISEYKKINGILTFRGNNNRNASEFAGNFDTVPTKIEIDWKFKTGYDNTETQYGTWGGGTGWTGQPIYIHWEDSLVGKFRNRSTQLTPNFSNKEIMVASLCGKLYFIDYESGKMSRNTFDVENIVKGSPSLDPSLNGNLYIGQGINRQYPFGFLCFNLFSHKQTYFHPKDNFSWGGWGAFDSSPIVVGQFLFVLGENGVIYKFSKENGMLKLHSKMRYKTKNRNAAGIESSLAVYKNYGYFCDNHGNIICINLNTLKPIFHYDNHDDSDATIVIEVVDGIPYIYSGSEVDKQGFEGNSYFVKLNGLTGEKIWENKIPGRKINIKERTLDGGMFSTPVLGKNDCEDYIFGVFCQNYKDAAGSLIAFEKKSGQIIYQKKLKAFSWSSPVTFLDNQNQIYIFLGDVVGNVYLYKGITGELLIRERIGNNFESSPVVINNTIVIGSRGSEIYKLSFK